MAIGCEDRETSYFLRMFPGDVRAVEYLTADPIGTARRWWSQAGPQGGLQSFVTAGLCPKVTALIGQGPGGVQRLCTRWPLRPRLDPWPWWLAPVMSTVPTMLKGHDAKKVQDTAGYFDGINFAAHIHCPALVSIGLLDITACPTAVIAAYNQFKGPKQIVIMPFSGHMGPQVPGVTQTAEYDAEKAWKDAMVAGQPPPIQK